MPVAHQDVIRAAYYALARVYHPDTDHSDSSRMAELNWAYDQVRDLARRQQYDRSRPAPKPSRKSSMAPVGPGYAPDWRVVSQPPPVHASADTAGPFSRARPTSPDGERYLDFGRYQGWSLRDLLHHDPDYLRWLSRHSSGMRYRAEILRLLPGEREQLGPLQTLVR
jgi:curved DNA-binding protein CbpA